MQNNKLLKTKRISKLKYEQYGDPVITFSLPGGQFSLLPPISYATATNTLNID